MDFWDLHRRMNDTLRDFWFSPFADFDDDGFMTQGQLTDGSMNNMNTPGDTRVQAPQSRSQLAQRGGGSSSGGMMTRAIIPRVNVDLIANKDNYVVKAEVPGVRKEDIQLSIKDGLVTISGQKNEEFTEKKDAKETGGVQYVRRERSSGSFSRSVRLPEDAAEQNIEAKHDHGVLTITIPRQQQKTPKKGNITIQ